MRFCFFLLLLPTGLFAQPGPPSFCFVLTEDRDALRPLESVVQVVQRYRERVPYVGINDTWLKPEETLPLQGGPLFGDSTESWTVYHPREGMAESFVLVVRGKDTMRIDLPEVPKQLVRSAWARANRHKPEVFRFRKGRYSAEVLVLEQWTVAAAKQLAGLLIAEDEAAYTKELAELEEYYRNQPPPVPPAPPYTPAPPMTEEDWATYWAQQPPLKEVRLERVSADTVRVRITGRVMLNGGCASNMPLFGVEMLTDAGWVERIPLELVQMDCGMPWADWEDHAVMLPPLRWWVGVNSLQGKKELLPGNYRLMFVVADMKQVRTAPFTME